MTETTTKGQQYLTRSVLRKMWKKEREAGKTTSTISRQSIVRNDNTGKSDLREITQKKVNKSTLTWKEFKKRHDV